MLLSNELPRLTDASGALVSRMLVLRLSRSWLGEEDPGLLGRLLPERPGILLWAVEGLRRLRRRGHFAQPQTGKAVLDQLGELSSPVTAFVQDCCELGADKTVAKNTLFERWRDWCVINGHEHGSAGTFGKNLLAAFPAVSTCRPRAVGERVRAYSGIGLQRLGGGT